MMKGAFAKPCAFVGAVRWQETLHDPPFDITLFLTTIAYALSEEHLIAVDSIHNRADDIVWVRQKLDWLWRVSGEELAMLQLSVRT